MTGSTARFLATILLTLCAVVMGCSKSGSRSAKGRHAFDAAAPEVKEAWNKAVEADKANDYVTAISAYKQLLSQQTNLQEAQVATVREVLGLLNQRLVTASMNGDSVAREALNTLGAMDRGQVKPH